MLGIKSQLKAHWVELNFEETYTFQVPIYAFTISQPFLQRHDTALLLRLECVSYLLNLHL